MLDTQLFNNFLKNLLNILNFGTRINVYQCVY